MRDHGRARTRNNKLKKIVERKAAQHGDCDQPNRGEFVRQNQVALDDENYHSEHHRTAETGDVACGFAQPRGPSRNRRIGRVAESKRDPPIKR